MHKVKLVTNSGDFVTYVVMPFFEKWPEVVQWGSRTFVFQPKGHGNYPIVYAEACCFVVTETAPAGESA